MNAPAPAGQGTSVSPPAEDSAPIKDSVSIRDVLSQAAVGAFSIGAPAAATYFFGRAGFAIGVGGTAIATAAAFRGEKNGLKMTAGSAVASALSGWAGSCGPVGVAGAFAFGAVAGALSSFA
jgi:hypothetical protein